MKILIGLLILFSTSVLFAQEFGPTSDSGNKDTSIMGGGTPGDRGERTLDQDEIQKQEKEEREKKQNKTRKQKEITDQNSTLDSI